jgi:protein-L-isoaspartate(D-aspartate) O-methyltransferase
MTHGVQSGPRTLVDRLVAAGELADPAWRAAFLAVPRHLFVPEHDRAAAYTDEPVVTQTRPAHTAGGGSLDMPTSSASAPSVVAVMLDRLAVGDGMRVLEIGTGTGYNAALLAHRLGDNQVYSVDLDPDLIATAGAAMASVGRRAHLVATDGYAGLPDVGPFDRIIATCAITHVPPPWIDQLAPGGRIVAPLLAEGWPLAVLDKTGDDEVTGRIDACQAAFMPLRREVDNPLSAGRTLGHPGTGIGQWGTTDFDPATIAEAEPDLRWFLALHTPGLVSGAVDSDRRSAVTLISPDGYAEASTTPGEDGRWEVIQRGRRLWDTAEHAMRDWIHIGKPDRTRYGISALDDADRQYVWLDDPDSRHAWPMPL